MLTSLTALFAAFRAFAFTLDRVGWFGEDVVWLGPRDAEPFRALTGLAFGAFPSCAPYGGQHDDVVPHLTIGHQGGAAALRAAGQAVRPHLPIEATATEVTLMAAPAPGTPGIPPGQWRPLAAFRLATPSPADLSARPLRLACRPCGVGPAMAGPTAHGDVSAPRGQAVWGSQ